MKIYRFRNCYLNPAERRVIKDGKYLELTTKTLDVLQLLIENAGEIVTKDEILGKVWSGDFVEEGNLAVHISKLRRLLGETKNLPFIETVQGSGYRFVAPVQEAKQSDWENISSGINPSLQNKQSREWTFDSIAVLPLQNESNDAEIEYLADGLTESFINNLSRLSNLKVIARNTVFRYKNKNADAKEVGETLGVATVLTGRIRVIKDRLTIGIELTKTDDGTQLWGTHFNRSFSDIFEIQESIFFEVLEKLKSEIYNISQKHACNAMTKNSESFRLYLKGKYLVDKRTEESIYKAIEFFKRSISYDYNNVYSYVEIVECYRQLYISDYISYTNVLIKIKPYLSTISKLNQSIDVVQAMYGGIKMYLDWDFENAEKYFQQALIINSNCFQARYCYTDFLIDLGRFSESLKELNQLILIDPLSLPNYRRIGRLFYKMGRLENAVEYLKEALEVEPADYQSLTILGAVLIELGDFTEAFLSFQRSLNIQFNIETLTLIGYASAREGRKDKAYEIIKQIESQSKSNFQYAMKLAVINLALGEKEIAYTFLEQTFDQHDPDLIAIKSDPRLKQLNGELRFNELLLKIGLPID